MSSHIFDRDFHKVKKLKTLDPYPPAKHKFLTRMQKIHSNSPENLHCNKKNYEHLNNLILWYQIIQAWRPHTLGHRTWFWGLGQWFPRNRDFTGWDNDSETLQRLHTLRHSVPKISEILHCGHSRKQFWGLKLWTGSTHSTPYSCQPHRHHKFRENPKQRSHILSHRILIRQRPSDLNTYPRQLWLFTP